MEVALEQELFSQLYVIADQLDPGVEVYTSLPDLSVPYPFIVIGEIMELPLLNKTHIRRRFSARIDVWGTDDQRFDVSTLATRLFADAFETKLGQHKARLRAGASTKRVLADNSVENLTLWRGILDLEMDIL